MLSICTIPVSTSIGCRSIDDGAVRSKIQRGADVRTTMRVSPGAVDASACISSIAREACPSPWPEM